MNSYTLGINGSWLLLAILAIAATGFALYSYRITIPPLSKPKKAVLITLRAIALALLLFVIFEPVATMITGKQEEPRLAILLDNSKSAIAKDAKNDRKEDFRLALENSGISELDANQAVITYFDSETDHKGNMPPGDLALDSLSHDGQMTNISKALRWMINSSQDKNIQSALLITDGEFNTGGNPIYDAEVAGKPVYVIGIGDSTEPKDIFIQSMLTNEIAYIDNPVPVNINIKANGYSEGELELELFDNGNKIAGQKIKLNPERNAYSALMEFNPKSEGVHKLTAAISRLEGEITYKNNRASEFIRVLKNKRRIALFAGAPSPDVSFIRNTIEKQEGIEIKPFIQKLGSEFYGGIPGDNDIRETELFLFIGFPISSTPANLLKKIEKELATGKPLFFIASKDTDYQKLKTLEPYLPFRVGTSRKQEFYALPDVKQSAMASPILKITGSDKDLEYWNQLPPLIRTETFVEVKPQSDVLATIKVNNAPLNEPLILTRSFQDRKSLAIIGYGIYRWKLSGYASDIAKNREETPDVFSIFLNNSLKWLSVNQHKKNVRIKTTKNNYTEKENVEFLGQIYDAAYNPVDNAKVSLKVRGGGDVRELLLSSLGNGRYYGKIDGLPPDDYAFAGDAELNGIKLGEDNGRFSVGEISLEFMNLKMNASLLREIAKRSGGKFYLPKDAGQFLEDLEKNSYFKPKSITIRSEIALWNLPWLLGAAILLFAAEWGLRKLFGML